MASHVVVPGPTQRVENRALTGNCSILFVVGISRLASTLIYTIDGYDQL